MGYNFVERSTSGSPASTSALQSYCGRDVAGIVVDKSGSVQNFPKAGELSHK